MPCAVINGTKPHQLQLLLTCLIAAPLAASPWLLDFGDSQAAAVLAPIIGILAVGLVLAEATGLNLRGKLGLVLAGLAAFALAAPWLFGFVPIRQALASYVVAALLWSGVAGWRLLTDDATAPVAPADPVDELKSKLNGADGAEGASRARVAAASADSASELPKPAEPAPMEPVAPAASAIPVTDAELPTLITEPAGQHSMPADRH